MRQITHKSQDSIEEKIQLMITLRSKSHLTLRQSSMSKILLRNSESMVIQKRDQMSHRKQGKWNLKILKMNQMHKLQYQNQVMLCYRKQRKHQNPQLDPHQDHLPRVLQSPQPQKWLKRKREQTYQLKERNERELIVDVFNSLISLLLI